jgi:hypothetical protein
MVKTQENPLKTSFLQFTPRSKARPYRTYVRAGEPRCSFIPQPDLQAGHAYRQAGFRGRGEVPNKQFLEVP